MKTVLPIAMLFFASALLAQQTERYEYLMMVQQFSNLYLTIGVDSFAVIKLREPKTSFSYLDFRPLMKKIYQFESEGWELVFNNTGGSGEYSSPHNYVMMRRRITSADAVKEE